MQDEARKYALDIVVAHQRRDQLSPSVRGATTSAANKIVFRVKPDDGEELSKSFRVDPMSGATRVEKPVMGLTADPLGHLERQAYNDPGTVSRYWNIVTLLEAARSDVMREGLPAHVDPPHYYEVSELSILERRDDRYVDAIRRKINRYLYMMMQEGLLRQAISLVPNIVTADKRNQFMNSYYKRKTELIDQIISELPTHTVRASTSDWRILLGAMGDQLAKKPILAPTGERSVELHPRPIADLQAELAMELSRLDNRIARCTIEINGQPRDFIIRTADAPRPTEEGRAAGEAIKRRSRELYGRPFAAIERGIRERLAIRDGAPAARATQGGRSDLARGSILDD